MTYTNYKQTLIEMGENLIEMGMIPDKRKK